MKNSVFDDPKLDLTTKRKVEEFCKIKKIKCRKWDQTFLDILNDTKLSGSFAIFLLTELSGEENKEEEYFSQF